MLMGATDTAALRHWSAALRAGAADGASSLSETWSLSL